MFDDFCLQFAGIKTENMDIAAKYCMQSELASYIPAAVIQDDPELKTLSDGKVFRVKRASAPGQNGIVKSDSTGAPVNGKPRAGVVRRDGNSETSAPSPFSGIQGTKLSRSEREPFPT